MDNKEIEYAKYIEMLEKKQENIRRRKNSKFLKFTKVYILLYLFLSIGFIGLLVYSDIFTLKVILLLSLIIFFIFVLCYYPMKSWKFRSSRRIIAFLIITVMLISYAFAGSYVYKTTKFINNISRISVSKNNINDNLSKESFNFYLTGLDTLGSIKKPSRSDVNMIVTVNPKRHKILLTSIPRDYYIPAGKTFKSMDKLTHSGIYGANRTLDSVNKFTGLDIKYYVKVNYSTLIKFIDTIGGVDIDSKFRFKALMLDNTKTDIEKGINHLNGQRTLAFVDRKSVV